MRRRRCRQRLSSLLAKPVLTVVSGMTQLRRTTPSEGRTLPSVSDCSPCRGRPRGRPCPSMRLPSSAASSRRKAMLRMKLLLMLVKASERRPRRRATPEARDPGRVPVVHAGRSFSFSVRWRRRLSSSGWPRLSGRWAALKPTASIAVSCERSTSCRKWWLPW